MAKVILEKVSKRFGEVVAVEDVSLETREGEFLVLVGPSGCGKTTTLRMIAGLEEITEGDIYIGDELVNNVPPKDRNIAMVFQNYALYPHMNVFDNMAFGLKLRKIPRDEIRKRVEEATEILGLQGMWKRKPRQLSGGQRQRVALGRAIVRHPKVFLMDEPLSNLDAKLRVQMRGELKKLHQTLGTTIVYVTHDQVEAMTLGERIVVLNKGIVHQIDTPLNLYGKPRGMFVAGFIGSPPMNFIEGRVLFQGGVPVFSAPSIEIKLPETWKQSLKKYQDKNGDKEVVLGIRPEHIRTSRFRGDEQLLDTCVDFGELMGSETYLHLKAGKYYLVARGDPALEPKLGEPLQVGLRAEKVHLFDKETSLRLSL